jgi:replicative DNA helicase
METAFQRDPKVPPHDEEAERSVLGGLLLDGQALYKALDAHLEADDFYRDSHQKIFQGVLDLESRGEPIDFVTLSARLKDMQELERIGGGSYLSGLLEEQFSAAHVGYYAKIIREKAILRRTIRACSEVVEEAYGGVQELDAFLDQAQSKIYSVAEAKDKGDFTAIKRILVDNFKKIEKLHQSNSQVTGISTGFVDFDQKTSGLQPGALYIIAARPAMGKTSLVMNMATHAGIRHNQGVAIFNLEMSKEELGLRILTSEARVDASRLKTGKLSDTDWRKLTRTAGALNNAPIFIDDSTDITLLEMKAKARRLKAKAGLSLLIVDYLQLMSGGARGAMESRERIISDVSRGLKGLAKELDIPVVALSQLNRGPDTRTDKRPMLSDLRESGAIEQDADLVAFVFREHVYDQNANPRLAELILAKHRSGSTGTVNLTWLGEYTSFENWQGEDEAAGS